MNDIGILLSNLAYALTLTILIEGAVTLLITRSKRFLLFNYWCNCLTNPLLNLAAWFLLGQTSSGAAYWAFAAVGETLVLFSEYWLYGKFDGRQQPKRRYFLLSLVTNAASFAAGELIATLIP